MRLTKKQLFVISIYFFSLLTVFNSVNIANSMNNEKIERDNLTEIKNLGQEDIRLDNSKEIEEPIGDFKLGESVLVKQNLSYSFLDHQKTQIEYTLGDTLYQNNKINANIDDGEYYNITVEDSDNNKYVRVDIYFNMFTQGNIGDLHEDQQIEILWNNGSTTNHFSFVNSFDVLKKYSNSGFLDLYISLEVTNTESTLNISYVREGALESLYSSSNSYANAIFESVRFYIDYIYFEQREVDYHLRSFYRYTTETMVEHKLIDYMHEYNEVKYYFTPLSWNFSYSIPYVDIFYNTTIGAWQVSKYNYQDEINLFFRSGSGLGVDYQRQNQFLCIDEVVSYNFEDNSLPNDFIERNEPYDFETEGLNTTIVANGLYSYLFKDTVVSYHNYFLNLEAGYYYLSVYIYIISISNTLEIEWYNGNSWEAYSINTSIINKWQTIFLYMEVGDPTSVDGNDVSFKFDLHGSGEFLIDKLSILEANPSLKTVGLNKYRFETILRNWDNLENPTLANKEIEYNARIRHNSTSLNSGTLLTNNLGIASTILEFTDSQLQNELELNSFCLENRFSDLYYDIYGNWLDFDEGIAETSFYPNGWGGVASYEDGYLIQTDGEDYSQMYVNFGSDISIDDYSIAIIKIKSNLTDKDQYFRWANNGGSVYSSSIWKTTTNFQIKYIDIRDFTNDGSIKYLYLYTFHGEQLELTIDYILYLKPQRTYLTTKDIEYNNMIVDFNYEDNSDPNEYSGSQFYSVGSDSITKGQLLTNKKSTIGAYVYHRFQFPTSFNTSIYRYLDLTLKVNYTLYYSAGYTIQIFSGNEDWSSWNVYLGKYIETINANEYIKIRIDLTEDNNNWLNLGTWDRLMIVLYDNGNNTYDHFANETVVKVLYDTIRLESFDNTSFVSLDSQFYTTSTNNTLVSYVTSDSNLLNPNSQDLDLNPLNNTVDSHTIEYIIYNDLDQEGCYIPSETYSYSYTIQNQTLLIMNYIDLLEVDIDTNFANVYGNLTQLSNQLNANITTVINLINDLSSIMDANFTTVINYLESLDSDLSEVADWVDYIYSHHISDWNNIVSNIDTIINKLDDLSTQLNANITTLINLINNLHDITQTNITYIIDSLDSMTTITDATNVMVYQIKNVMLPDLESKIDNIQANVTTIISLVNSIIDNQNNFTLIINSINDLSDQLNLNITEVLSAISEIKAIQLANASTLATNILNLSDQLNMNTTQVLQAINYMNFTKFVYNLQFDQSFNETVKEFPMFIPDQANIDSQIFVSMDVYDNYTGSDITVIWEDDLEGIIKSYYYGKAIVTDNKLEFYIDTLSIEGNYTITVMLTNEYLVAFSQAEITLTYNYAHDTLFNYFFNNLLINFTIIGGLVIVIYCLYKRFSSY